jgi:hypothetical protein
MKFTNIKLQIARSGRFVLVGFLAFATNIRANASGAQPADSSEAVVATNPEMQTLFGELAAANDPATRETLWDQLRQYDRTDRAALVQQLTLFASGAKSTRSAMLVGAVILDFKMSDADVVEALIPLMATDDPKLQKQIKGTLAEYEDQSASRPPDFSTYRAIIEKEIREGRDAPAGLVRHMYDVDPGVALLTMMRASQMQKPEELREVLWAEHVVSDSIWKKTHGFVERDTVDPLVSEQLERLAGHTEWWARLYVPTIMKRHPTLQSADLLEKLSKDPDTSVANAARELR